MWSCNVRDAGLAAWLAGMEVAARGADVRVAGMEVAGVDVHPLARLEPIPKP